MPSPLGDIGEAMTLFDATRPNRVGQVHDPDSGTSCDLPRSIEQVPSGSATTGGVGSPSQTVDVQGTSGTRDLESLIDRVVDPTSLVERNVLKVHLRYEEDVAAAYRAYYRDQVVVDKRNELGRFLFGVSFTTLGFIVSVLKISTPDLGLASREARWLLGSLTFLLFSAVCSLRLAVPKNQTVNPTTLELVAFHRVNSIELSRLSFVWFALWLVGLVLGLLSLVT